jgi:ATP-dependent RNA helicase RhlE
LSDAEEAALSEHLAVRPRPRTTDPRRDPRPAPPASSGPAATTFASLGVSRPVIDALKMRGIDAPFAIQTLVIADAIAGRDVLAKSRTGSGKTLAFAVPIVERTHPDTRSPTALILAPTRELASQVAEDFRAITDVKRLKVATVYGGVGIQAQAKSARHADIVIATPGRLLDLVQRKLLRLDRVRIAVLDEADRMLDMGFLPDVTRILQLVRVERQTMLFSATLDGEVGRLAERFTQEPVRHEVRDDRPTVAEADHRFVSVDHAQKTNALVRELAGDRGLTLVFVRTKRGADRLAKRLKTDGFRVGALHGGMTQPARERALGHFASGDHDVLVATDVAARGLDLAGISHVINFDAPEDEKAYVHRVGRTARAGRTGTGITFVTPEQRVEVGKMAKLLKLHVEFVDSGMKIDSGAPGRSAGGRNQPPRNRNGNGNNRNRRNGSPRR